MHLIEASWWQRAVITHQQSCVWIAALTNDERKAARGNCRPVLSKIHHSAAARALGAENFSLSVLTDSDP